LKQELSTQEMRDQTLVMLGSAEPSIVTHIDDDYASEEAEQFDIDSVEKTRDANGILCAQWYGHSMAYGSRNGEPTYEYRSTSSCAAIDGVCLGTRRYWNYQSQVNHFSTGHRCRQNNNHTAVVLFRSRR